MKLGRFALGMSMVTLLSAAAIVLLKSAQGFCEGFFAEQ